MSDEIKTPAGRTLRLETTFENGDREYGIAGTDAQMFIGQCCSDAEIAGNLAKIDARADETVAALLPPGAIVVTEERVRELLGFFPGDLRRAENRGDANEAIDEFLSALRAGAQS